MVEKCIIFISYARKNAIEMQELIEHMKPIERIGIADIWFDQKIKPGEEWDKEILDYLNRSAIVVCLITKEFINSDYCYCTELITAMARADKGVAKIIPVIIRPCDWTRLPFSKFNVLPDKGVPIISYQIAEQDQCLSGKKTIHMSGLAKRA